MRYGERYPNRKIERKTRVFVSRGKGCPSNHTTEILTLLGGILSYPSTMISNRCLARTTPISFSLKLLRKQRRTNERLPETQNDECGHVQNREQNGETTTDDQLSDVTGTDTKRRLFPQEADSDLVRGTTNITIRRAWHLEITSLKRSMNPLVVKSPPTSWFVGVHVLSLCSGYDIGLHQCRREPGTTLPCHFQQLHDAVAHPPQRSGEEVFEERVQWCSSRSFYLPRVQDDREEAAGGSGVRCEIARKQRRKERFPASRLSDQKEHLCPSDILTVQEEEKVDRRVVIFPREIIDEQ